MTLSPGDRRGPFEILSALGAGGMGEVYRARDTKLDRDVALKVLPEGFTSDAERVARFQREAKTLAALNHPHIAQIHGLDDTDGTLALVMELVEGPTLAERIAEGPLPADEALPIATQIAEALSAAHEAGIVHRDLKPANVKVRPDGTVKVLDFGLAKALEPAEALSPDSSRSPTMTSPAMTQAGVILGTAAYMSPEQARGRAVDRRTDVWAFGCVLFEMLAGKRAFEGEDVSMTLSKILQVEPDFDALPAGTPSRIRQALRVCLQKEWRERAGDIHDVRLALEGAFEVGDPQPGVPGTAAGSARSRAWPIVATAVVLAVVGGLAAWLLSPRPAERPVSRFTVALPGQAVRGPDRNVMALSRDGRRFVVNTEAGLALRPMDSLETAIVPGTEAELRNPFFSPDGQSLGYYDLTTSELKRVSLGGGVPVVIFRSANLPTGASWESDGTILFAQRPGEGIWRVPANGGTPEVVIAAANETERMHGPQLLPGGDRVLFSVTRGASWDAGQVVAQSLSTGTRTVLIEGGSDARYLPTGHLVFARENDLLAVAFDAERLAVLGGAVTMVQGVLRATRSASANYGVSEDGTLVYVAGSGVVRNTLVWVDRDGREEPLATPARAYTYLRLSPDGTQVALDVREEDNDIWIWDLEREALRRLTLDPGLDRAPVWAPDGQRIAFSSTREGAGALVFWRAADGSGAAERVTPGLDTETEYPQAFSPDGEALLYTRGGGTNRDLRVVSIRGERQATPLIETPASEYNAEVSPDGRWVAYESYDSGQFEVFVSPFPDVEQGRWLLSGDGGNQPLWSRDGRELFYRETPGRVMAVAIQPGEAFAYGSPQVVFEGPYLAPLQMRSYDVSPDGRRFLMIKATPSEASPTLIVVEGWFEELRQRVPAEP